MRQCPALGKCELTELRRGIVLKDILHSKVSHSQTQRFSRGYPQGSSSSSPAPSCRIYPERCPSAPYRSTRHPNDKRNSSHGGGIPLHRNMLRPNGGGNACPVDEPVSSCRKQQLIVYHSIMFAWGMGAMKTHGPNLH